MQNNLYQRSILEITILSAQGLKTPSFFRPRLRPFTVIATNAAAGSNGQYSWTRQKTKVDETGGENPSWGDTFNLPFDPSIHYRNQFGIYLQIYTKNPVFFGRSHLGWCHIPAVDVVDRLPVAGSVGFLSYRLRERDGSRGQGIVNVALRLQGFVPLFQGPRSLESDFTQQCVRNDETVIGVPVTISKS